MPCKLLQSQLPERPENPNRNLLKMNIICPRILKYMWVDQHLRANIISEITCYNLQYCHCHDTSSRLHSSYACKHTSPFELQYTNTLYHTLMKYSRYKDDPEMRQVTHFVCFRPVAMCELYLKFKKSLVVVATGRYEEGRLTPDRWRQLNANLTHIQVWLFRLILYLITSGFAT